MNSAALHRLGGEGRHAFDTERHKEPESDLAFSSVQWDRIQVDLSLSS